jgi:hypothetical protein
LHFSVFGKMNDGIERIGIGEWQFWTMQIASSIERHDRTGRSCRERRLRAPRARTRTALEFAMIPRGGHGLPAKRRLIDATSARDG